MGYCNWWEDEPIRQLELCKKKKKNLSWKDVWELNRDVWDSFGFANLGGRGLFLLKASIPGGG
jgi:hypothetical protein